MSKPETITMKKETVARRFRMDQWCEAELAIDKAMQTIERMEANVLLTEAQTLLSQARNKVADYIDTNKTQEALDELNKFAKGTKLEVVDSASIERFMPDQSERDWTEDFSHENGKYQNECMRCKKIFYGHKRRVVCKVCDSAHERTSEDLLKQVVALMNEYTYNSFKELESQMIQLLRWFEIEKQNNRIEATEGYEEIVERFVNRKAGWEREGQCDGLIE